MWIYLKFQELKIKIAWNKYKINPLLFNSFIHLKQLSAYNMILVHLRKSIKYIGAGFSGYLTAFFILLIKYAKNSLHKTQFK